MMTAPSEMKMLAYSNQDRTRFKKYFCEQERKKKRGRPRKRKRKQKKTKTSTSTIKTVPKRSAKKKKKARRRLFAKLNAVAEKAKREDLCRINWDIEPHKSHRERVAQSWLEKNDLYKEGESFGFFCKKHVIDRNVLRRYLESKETGKKSNKRGRPTHLSESVMRHVCEGQFFFVLAKIDCSKIDCRLLIASPHTQQLWRDTMNSLKVFLEDLLLKWYSKHPEAS